MNITIAYDSIDRFHMLRHFKTVAGARRFAVKWVGENADFGGTYAVSPDGVGKITVEGISLNDLFGREPEAVPYGD